MSVYLALVALAEGAGVTHKADFTQKIADRVVFMNAAQIIEENETHGLFDNSQSDRLIPKLLEDAGISKLRGDHIKA